MEKNNENDFLAIINIYINRIEAEREEIAYKCHKNGKIAYNDRERYTLLTNLLNKIQEKLIYFEFLRTVIKFKGETEFLKQYASTHGIILTRPHLLPYIIKYQALIKDFVFLLSCMLKSININNFSFSNINDIKDMVSKSNKSDSDTVAIYISFYDHIVKKYYRLLEDVDSISEMSYKVLLKTNVLDNILSKISKELGQLIKYLLNNLCLVIREYQYYFPENEGLNQKATDLIELYEGLSSNLYLEGDNFGGRK